MKRLYFGILFLLIGIVMVQPASAQDRINYGSQPDELVVFFNDIAFARDNVTLPGGVDVQIVLPQQVFPDTLIVRENEQRVPAYRLSRMDNQLVVQWTSETDSDVRDITIEYLLSGVGWSPKYDMWLGDDAERTVALDFFAEIRNSAFSLEGIPVKLVAGRVDTAQPLDEVSRIAANQYLAGYAEADLDSAASFTGTASIQHVYEIGDVSALPGEIVYTRLQTGMLPARRLHLWNAQLSPQVTVIYKVSNVSQVPFAEGIVRTYQDDLFLGSDFIELTPIGGEGSVTVGNLQNVRANRSETQRALDGPSDRDTLHTVTLTVENFGDDAVEIEIVDRFSSNALEFEFSREPEIEGDNVLRWVIEIEAGETAEIQYTFKD